MVDRKMKLSRKEILLIITIVDREIHRLENEWDINRRQVLSEYSIIERKLRKILEELEKGD